MFCNKYLILGKLILMAKFFKISALILLIIAAVAATLAAAFFIVTADAKLDPQKLAFNGAEIIFYDAEDNEIISTSYGSRKKTVETENLNRHTIDAFIASEDRNFYKHNGLNFKRMIKAMYKNAVSRSFKEGASTISQQLIKNTHLTNDKTIKRKLKEIRLTLQLEKKYSKNEILQTYLNTIYFGHNCYGLQSAAEFYFSKNAEDLNLNESATIVGLLASPNNYSPFKNPEKCLQRRNIVLKAMLKCGFITQSEYDDAVKQPVNATPNPIGGKNADYLERVYDELEEINLDKYLLGGGCIVKTYMDGELQSYAEEIQYPCDNAVIVCDNATMGVKAYKSTVGEAKRQPGSTVKPLFVYAPAMQEKLMSPFTKINDEKIDYGGYSPENYDKKYHGYVTMSESLAESYNVPAVKTLNSLTLPRAEKYLTAMNVKLDEEEKNLSLALGGMKYGLTLKEIAERYSIFPNKGAFQPAKFIKQIVTRDGKILYEAKNEYSNVFSTGVCSLMNETLENTVKSGTAKKLNCFNFDLAAKTGTVGDGEGNTDAYSIAYTSENVFALWLGDKDNKKSEITGGGQCCALLKKIIEKKYKENTPPPLDVDEGTVTSEIDLEEYNINNKIVIADKICPKLNRMKIKTLADNRPQETSTKFTEPDISTPTVKVSENTVNIELCQTKYYSYIVNRTQNGKKSVIYDGKWKKVIDDKPECGCYIYSVIPYYQDGNSVYYGKEILLPAINISDGGKPPQIKIPDIAYGDWYNR